MSQLPENSSRENQPLLSPLSPRPIIRQRKAGRLGTSIDKLTEPRRYLDGNGLILNVCAPGQRYWIYRYQARGRTREMGLGSAANTSLAEARRRHAEARGLVARGLDPLDIRNASAPPKPSYARATWAAVCEEFLTKHGKAWRNPKHAAQWRTTLAETYPTIGGVRVADLKRSHVLRVLEPIWQIKPVTASRTRGRMQQVLDYAAAEGYRAQADNPAAWEGNLKWRLASPNKIHTTKHHPALDWREAPVFFTALGDQPGFTAVAMRFAILTGVRSGEVRGALWSEFDFHAGVWTIPEERMKKGDAAHRIPLSKPALLILMEMARLGRRGLVFPSLSNPGKPLSDMAFSNLLRRMQRRDITTHGFRSTLTDWAREHGFPPELTEMALAHKIKDKVRSAYERTDLFDARRTMLALWGDYLTQPIAHQRAA